MIETTTDTAVQRKRRNEIESKVSRKKRKAEKRKEEEPSDQEDQEEERAQQMESSPIQIPTPEYVPPEFSSEEERSDEEDSLPIQSHANIDLVTFDSLNSSTVKKLIQERDRLGFVCLSPE